MTLTRSHQSAVSPHTGHSRLGMARPTLPFVFGNDAPRVVDGVRAVSLDMVEDVIGFARRHDCQPHTSGLPDVDRTRPVRVSKSGISAGRAAG